MDNRDLRDINVYGTLSVVCGVVQLLMSAMGIMLVLATGGSQLPMPTGLAIFLAATLVVVSCGLVGLGGELARANRATALARENLRLTWTAMFLLQIAGFVIGLWLLPVLAAFLSVMILGLVWIRQPVIRLTS